MRLEVKVFKVEESSLLLYVLTLGALGALAILYVLGILSSCGILKQVAQLFDVCLFLEVVNDKVQELRYALEVQMLHHLQQPLIHVRE